ncbi:UDP-N-acetylmuramoyl-L-alanyl-D-glutamate--2,6-diaminopimelate ligase [Sulfuriflexus mobilis]|uniref:UDP-N-acetylmuramoyl-L-alanyl-D-glutamate--2, 6-diaminopimelate ligase n=1 Tax=Sulfuriflexus mobilis TaxID=1811807 RepID=UPI000F821400|nr:UDP-N-acetylmuramoyl-L-alanyl-D-glutamate--2,6-diaminopimelate ligase [Sulfuriflexus mobilis]
MMTVVQPPVRAYPLASLLADLAERDITVSCDVTGMSLNSDQIQSGDLFLACAGLRSHGLQYAESAVKKGAVAIAYETPSEQQLQGQLGEILVPLQGLGIPLVAVKELSIKVGVIAERFYGQPSQAMHVIGITGTNGKTSCSHFLASLLSTARAPCGLIGTLGNGKFGQLTSTTHTTPDAVTLHKLFAEMRDDGLEYVCMEVSSHGLEQGRVSGVSFDTAVFTNLTRDHLDYHGDMENYARSKQLLFEQAGLRYAVINADDAFGRELLISLPDSVQSVAYSLSEEGNAESTELRHSVMHLGCVQGSDLHFSGDGMSVQVSSPWGDGELQSPLFGRFNASNVLAVMAVALLTGMRLPSVLAGIQQLQSVPGRMQKIESAKGQPMVVVDYAHSPDALEQALSALRVHCRSELYCVFGCGGDRDRGKRPLMGSVAEQWADHIILTDDNPRSEDSRAIIEDIRGGIQNTDKLHIETDRRAAIAYAIARAGSSDIILVAGKGHENYQLIGDQRLPFNDAEVIAECLGGDQ